MRKWSAVLPAALLLAAVTGASGSPVTILQPSGDRWMYWFGDATGTRPSASTYGAYGAFDYISQGYDFDDRHGQMFLDFDTTAIAPAGLDPASYHLGSITVRLVVNEGNAFVYDPTADPLGTYTGASSDADVGRPIELFGVGYRGGFSAANFNEASPYITGQYQTNPVVTVKGRRNSFAMDFVAGAPRDVSNNVEESFEVQPWAVGQVPGYADFFGELVPSPLAPGALVPFDSVMTFELDLSRPDIRSYVQQGLHRGRLHLMVTSLKEYDYSGGGGAPSGGGFPSFYTKENFNHSPTNGVYLAARLAGSVAVKPPVAISRLSPSGFRLSFPTLPGHQYQPRHRPALNSTNYTLLGAPIVGDGTVKTVDDPVGAVAALRFYDLEVINL